jgi:hypothetical protein
MKISSYQGLFPLASIITALLNVVTVVSSLGAGIAFTVETPISQDSTAKLVIYENINNSGSERVLTFVDGSKISYNYSKIRATVEVPDLDQDFDSASKIASLRVARSELEAAKIRFGKAHETVISLISRIDALLPEFDKGKYRISGNWVNQKDIQVEVKRLEPRSAAVENRFDSLRDSTGNVYRNVVVVRVDPNGLNIRHDGGATKLDFKDLPEQIRVKFGYSEESAISFAAAEKVKTQQLHALNLARKSANNGETLVELTIDPSNWEALPNDSSIVYQFVELRLYNNEEKTTSIARENALGGAGLADSITTRTRVYTDKRIVAIIVRREYTQSVPAGVFDDKVYPIVPGALSNSSKKSKPYIYSLEPELAARFIEGSSIGFHSETLSSMETIAIISARIVATVFQNLGEGDYLIEIGEDLYKLTGCSNSYLTKDMIIAFAGTVTNETFEYTNGFGALRSVGVIEFLSNSVQNR